MKAKGVLIAGSAGGGKTTYGREVFDKHDGVAVWVNHSNERVPDATTCRSPGDLSDEAKRCTTKRELRRLRIDYNAPDPVQGTQDAKRFAQAVASASDRDVCTLVVVDEAHNVLPDNEDSSTAAGNPLAWMLHEGRDQNIKPVLMTQDPTELYYPPIKQCKHIVWCGEVKTFHSGFLRYYGLQDLDLPTRDHQFAVIKPTLPPKIVTEGTTNEAYA